MTPILLYGALRSGTTLLRLMVEAHPALSNPGEADFLFDHLHGPPDARRYDLQALRDDRVFRARALDLPEGLDGRPLLEHMLRALAAKGEGVPSVNIHRHVDVAARLLPDLKVVHLLRDPRDVARSCIGMGWAGAPYHGVAGWIGTETAWDRALPLIAPERRLEMRFEDLVADPKAELERLCAFMGVPYDPAMLEFHRSSTYDALDPAIAGRWRRTADPRDVALVESRLGPLLESRGYAPSGHPPTPPAPAERLVLAARDRMGVWRFGLRRYGAPRYLGEKLTRRLGLRAANRRHRLAMQAIDTRHLK